MVLAEWESIAELPEALEGFASVSIPKVGIFIFGGANKNMEEQNDLYQYSPTNNAWTKLASSEAPMGRSCCGMTFHEKDGQVSIYIFGGLNSGVGWLGDIWKGQLDQGKVSWSQLEVDAVEFTPRDKVTCVKNENECFIIGGFGPMNCAESEDEEEVDDDIKNQKENQEAFSIGWFDDVVRLDFTNDKVESLPIKGLEGAASKAASGGFINKDNNILLFGGKGTAGRTNEMFLYDVKSQTWESEKPGGFLPAPRSFFASAAMDNKFYIFGGQGKNDELLGGLHQFASGKWSKIETKGASLTPRRQSKMEFYDGVLYLFGGTDQLDPEQGISSVLKESWKGTFVQGSADSDLGLLESAMGLKRRNDE